MKATTHFSLFTFHFALMATVSSAMSVDAPFTYSGSYTVAAHPSLENTVVATFTSSGTISVTNRAKIVRVLVVGGGGGGWTSGNAVNGEGGRGGGGAGGSRGGTSASPFSPNGTCSGIPGGDGLGGGGGGSTSGKAISPSGARGGRGVLVLRYHPAPGGTFILLR